MSQVKVSKQKYSFALVVLTALSVTFCIAANLISSRIGYFGPWLAPMGVFFFPFIYVISDILGDVYGYRVSRWVAWLTLLMQLMFVAGLLAVINAVTGAPFVADVENALKLLLIGTNGFGGMIRVVLAGIVGATLGGWVNDIVFQIFRHKDGVSRFAKRKVISTAAAEATDTFVFITLAFYATPAWGIAMYVVQFCLKYIVEMIVIVPTKLAINKLRKVEGEQAFEDRNKFNIFGFYKN